VETEKQVIISVPFYTIEEIVAGGKPGILSQVEKRTIELVMEKNNGNRLRTAVALGIHTSTLASKLKLYGLGRPESNHRPMSGAGDEPGTPSPGGQELKESGK